MVGIWRLYCYTSFKSFTKQWFIETMNELYFLCFFESLLVLNPLFMIFFIATYKTDVHKEKGSGLSPWPRRLVDAPQRLEDIGVNREDFLKDSVILITS